MGGMYERLGVVEQERLLPGHLAVDVVESIFLHRIRAVLRIFVMLSVVVPHAVGIPVGLFGSARLAVELHLREEGLVESQFVRQPAVAAQLPFADHGGAVASLPDALRKGGLVGVHVAERHVVAVVVETGHGLHSRGGAERLGVSVGVHQALGCEPVDVGGLIFGSALAYECFGSYVVRQEKDDVGLLLRALASGQCSRCNAKVQG